MKKTITLLLVTLVLFVNAQDGTLDTSFGNSGKVDYTGKNGQNDHHISV